MSRKRGHSALSAPLAASSSAQSRSLTPFSLLVYSYTMSIPAGSYTTYADLATAIGRPKASRAVGNALRHNPFAPYVPCHRILASDRTIGGFNGATDPNSSLIQKKLGLLASEGVRFVYGKASDSCLLDWSTVSSAKSKVPVFGAQELIQRVEAMKKLENSQNEKEKKAKAEYIE
jgi:methylated-DNA-[protein]-cysteine S-methyltransferase